MSNDIVTELRNHQQWLSATSTSDVCAKAAQEIEKLREQNAHLEALLLAILKHFFC